MTNYATAAATARANWDAARSAYAAATTKKARHNADMDIQFWSGKMAAVAIAKRNNWPIVI